MGVASAVPSGWVHRAFAPGLAHMMSSGSGPARFDEKGTLKDRLTCVPGGMTGGAEVAVEGRLIGAATGISWLDLEKGKPVEGAIFSQPCLAEPVKVDILCMVGVVWRAPWGRTGEEMGVRKGRSERTRKVGEQQHSTHATPASIGPARGTSVHPQTTPRKMPVLSDLTASSSPQITCSVYKTS